MVNVCFGISIPPCIPDDSEIGSKVRHISFVAIIYVVMHVYFSTV